MEDLSRQVTNVPGKISTIMEESVKYLQNFYIRKALDEKNEMEKVRKIMTGTEEHTKAGDIIKGEMINHDHDHGDWFGLMCIPCLSCD